MLRNTAEGAFAPTEAAKKSLAKKGEVCYIEAAFVALVKPLDSFKGAASPHLRPLFVSRLEASEKRK